VWHARHFFQTFAPSDADAKPGIANKAAKMAAIAAKRRIFMVSFSSWYALSCAHIVLIRKSEAIFNENRWLRHNFRIKTRRLRDTQIR
jgi:hypothetical protein